MDLNGRDEPANAWEAAYAASMQEQHRSLVTPDGRTLRVVVRPDLDPRVGGTRPRPLGRFGALAEWLRTQAPWQRTAERWLVEVLGDRSLLPPLLARYTASSESQARAFASELEASIRERGWPLEVDRGEALRRSRGRIGRNRRTRQEPPS